MSVQRPVYRVPFPRYHTYTGLCDELEFLAREFADIAEVITLMMMMMMMIIIMMMVGDHPGPERGGPPDPRPQDSGRHEVGAASAAAPGQVLSQHPR